MCVACHPLSTMLVSGGFDETIRLWDLQRGTCHRTIPAHSDAVTSVDFCADGTMIASCSHDGLMYVCCSYPDVYGTPMQACVCAHCNTPTKRRWPRCDSRRRPYNYWHPAWTARSGYGTWQTRAYSKPIPLTPTPSMQAWRCSSSSTWARRYAYGWRVVARTAEYTCGTCRPSTSSADGTPIATLCPIWRYVHTTYAGAPNAAPPRHRGPRTGCECARLGP